MGFFECCHKCVAPKRYPGCSGTCPEYAEQKILFEARKAIERKRTLVPPAKTDYLNSAFWQSRNRRKKR